MRRAGWWLAGAAVVAWAVVLVAGQFSGRGVPWWVGMLPWIAFAVLVGARVARELATPTSRRPVRRALGPGAQGLDEVQGIQLGRPAGLRVTYGDDEPTAAELVVPRSDDLDRGPWTIARRRDGSVVVDTGRPGGEPSGGPGLAAGAEPGSPGTRADGPAEPAPG